MGQAIRPSEIELVEPIVAPTIHAHGVARYTVVGTDIQMLLYADQVGLDGKTEHALVARLVMPIDVTRNNNSLIAQFCMVDLANRDAAAQ